MKYFFIYSSLFVLLTIVWVRAYVIENRLDRVQELKVESFSPMIIEDDSLYMDVILKKYKSLQLPPPDPVPNTQLKSEKSFLEFSNEIITLIIGLGNIITLVFQLKDRKRKQPNTD